MRRREAERGELVVDGEVGLPEEVLCHRRQDAAGRPVLERVKQQLRDAKGVPAWAERASQPSARQAPERKEGVDALLPAVDLVVAGQRDTFLKLSLRVGGPADVVAARRRRQRAEGAVEVRAGSTTYPATSILSAQSKSSDT